MPKTDSNEDAHETETPFLQSYGKLSLALALLAAGCLVSGLLLEVLDRLSDGQLSGWLLDQCDKLQSGDLICMLIVSLPVFAIFPCVAGFTLGKVGQYEEGKGGRCGRWGVRISAIVFFAIVLLRYISPHLPPV
jgi:hypothetical protein